MIRFRAAAALLAVGAAGLAVPAQGPPPPPVFPEPYDPSLPRRAPLPAPPAAPVGKFATARFAVGPAANGGPRVRVFDGKGETLHDFYAYDEQFAGGVRPVLADINGDGVPDLVTAPGPGMAPLVRVFDGRDASKIAEFLAYDEGMKAGVNVAAAARDKNGRALVAVGPGPGGAPHVRVFDLGSGKEVVSFFAFPEQLTGGARVALADVNGDGVTDLIAAPGPCPYPPTVRVFDLARTGKPIAEFNAFEATWQGGVWVAAAPRPGGNALVAVGADNGGGPIARVFNPLRGQSIADIVVTQPDFRGGVHVGLADLTGNGTPELLTVPGPGLPAVLRAYRLNDRKKVLEVDPFAGFPDGAFVGGI